MTTEEKIKLYEELHPEGKELPKTKKPDEKPEDMERLDKKIQEFQALKGKENQTSDADITPQEQGPTISITPSPENVKIYTVDQIKCLPDPEFKMIQQMVGRGEAKIVNQRND